MFPPKLVALLIALIAVISGGAYGVSTYLTPAKKPAVAVITYATPEESDPYVRFDMEAYDSIMKNYWKKVSEADLAQLFQQSVAKASSSSTPLTSSDRKGTAKMLSVALNAQTGDAKKQLAINTLIVALYNLPPVGRDQLLSAKQETTLRQEVSNIDPNKDLYADVGATAGASVDDVKTAYLEKKAELEKATSTEAKQQLVKAKYAYDVLTKDDTKTRYDTAKVEPTVFTHKMGTTLYLFIEKMSPTTLDEFVSAINAGAKSGMTSLIIDLRGNIGGSLDIAPSFVGLFEGQNSYVFDLFHQDDYQVLRSPAPKLDSLAQFSDTAVLTDNMTQSTAEVITAALKRFHLAHSVGGTTRGWGSVENTYPLSTTIDPTETYTMLLVNSLTLRDDNQPIESRGVDPDVAISDPAWRTELVKYFRSSSLIEALRAEASKPPIKD
jgi:hypothetical protein